MKVVIGAGLVGLATVLQILRRQSRARVIVLERENEVAMHQSGHNTGVLHAGLYYRPGSYKARLAVWGVREMIAFCRTHEIAHEVCGKLVVAIDKQELTHLKALYERGKSNGLAGLRWPTASEARDVEPLV